MIKLSGNISYSSLDEASLSIWGWPSRKVLITWNVGSLSSLAMANLVFLFTFSGPEIHQAGISIRGQIWGKLQRHFWNSANQQEQFSVWAHFFVIFVHLFPTSEPPAVHGQVPVVSLIILLNDMQRQSYHTSFFKLILSLFQLIYFSKENVKLLCPDLLLNKLEWKL